MTLPEVRVATSHQYWLQMGTGLYTLRIQTVLIGMKRNNLRRKPVTLIVGILCKDGIVVAADSQTSWDTGKRYDANKMTDMKYSFGRALIAQSGAVITSQAIIEELKKLSNKSEAFEFPSLAGLAAQSVRKVRDKLRFQHFDCSAEELQSIIREEGLDCALMIADHSGKEPRIDTVNLLVGIPSRSQSYFETIGSGSDLATMLLTDLCTPNMEMRLAAIIAVHVVELVKRHDPYCGGPTRLGMLRKPEPRVFEPPAEVPAEMAGISAGYNPQVFAAFQDFLSSEYLPPVVLSQEDTDEIVKMASEIDAATKRRRMAIIRKALEEQSVKVKLTEAPPEEDY
jgi:20S proteasome alpha/beta subunit